MLPAHPQLIELLDHLDQMIALIESWINNEGPNLSSYWKDGLAAILKELRADVEGKLMRGRFTERIIPHQCTNRTVPTIRTLLIATTLVAVGLGLVVWRW